MANIQSMTAFARSEANFDGGTLLWEVRSVNHRYLELQFRVPDHLGQLEMPCRAQARERLGRGKVDCALRLQLDERNSGGMQLDEEQLQRVSLAAKHIRASDPSLAPHTAIDILKWPGVVAQQQPDMDVICTQAEALFGATLVELSAMREREGEALAELIRQRLDRIEAIAAEVRAALPRILESMRQRLQERVDELSINIDQERLEQEIVLLAQKADVAEELDRLETHVRETRRTLKIGGACGRRLDFLMQEFNREANTLSSKAVVSETTQSAVELKVLIEQMREQIQNIE